MNTTIPPDKQLMKDREDRLAFLVTYTPQPRRHLSIWQRIASVFLFLPLSGLLAAYSVLASLFESLYARWPGSMALLRCYGRFSYRFEQTSHLFRTYFPEPPPW